MAESDKILSQHEVDALLSAIDSGSTDAAPDPSAEPYDFRRPARIPPDQLRFLQTLHEGYARTFQAALSGLLLRPVEARVTSLQQLPLREFMEAQPRPSMLYLLSAEPLEGNFLIAFNPLIAYPMIERLLGASKINPPQRDRPLSSLEWNVADTLANRALDLLQEAWTAVAPVRFKILRRESDPGVLRFDNADEPSVAVSLEVAVGDQRGAIEIAFPTVAIEGYLSRMIATASFSAKKKETPGTGAAISQRLAPAQVEVEVHLPEELLRLAEIEALRPGDVLLTSHSPGAPLRLTVEGRAKFLVRLGSLKDRKAVKVTAPAPPPDSTGPAMPAMAVLKGVAPLPEGGTEPPGHIQNLLQVPLTASVVLAEKSMRVKDVMALKPGDLLDFPNRAEEALEFRAARHAIARGTCVKVGDAFGLRITSIPGPVERLRALGP